MYNEDEYNRFSFSSMFKFVLLVIKKEVSQMDFQQSLASINYFAVIVAALSAFIIGGLLLVRGRPEQ